MISNAEILERGARIAAMLESPKEEFRASTKLATSTHGLDGCSPVERDFHHAMWGAGTQFSSAVSSDPILSKWSDQAYAAKIDIDHILSSVQ